MQDKIVDIVLIEDNPNDAELAIRALKKKNLAKNLLWLKDGEEALDYLLSLNKDIKIKRLPKLILLDLKLPKVSGIDVLEKIKTNKDLFPIPVVVLTSSKEERDISACYKNNVNSYIAKPVDFSEFMTTISDIGLYWLNLNQPFK